MLKKEILFFGKNNIVACDGKCNKAWGINSRPKIQLSDDGNDYAFLSDLELGEAPKDPGTYEGGCAKPRNEEERLNKWCVRECERKYLDYAEKGEEEIVLENFNQRVYNMSWRRKESAKE